MAWCYWALAGYEVDMSAITHTHQLPFIRLRNRQKQTKIKCACKESTQIALIFVTFRFLVRGGWRLAQKEFRCAAGRLDGIWYPLLGLKGHNMVVRARFEVKRDHMHRQY